MTRARRVPRLSGKEAVILELLAGGGERYGLELVSASRGHLKRGTVYVTLGRMEEKGYVSSRLAAPPEGDGPQRRVYRATPHGARVLHAWTAFLAQLSPEHA